MNLVTYPSAILTSACSPVSIIDDDVKTAVLEMIDIMYFHNGVGLAAPQVGIQKRFFVADASGGNEQGMLRCFINPKIVLSRGLIMSQEGCLSLPGARGRVVRASEIKIDYQDIEGTVQSLVVDGLLATIVQHECDHLDGKLFIDHLNRHDKKVILKQMRAKEIK
jgi:peptide deformylase